MSRGAVVKIEHRDSACALAKTPCSCLIEDANYSNELPTDPSRCCVGAGGSGIDAPVLLLMCSLAGLSRVSSDPVEFGGDADPDSGNVHGFDDAAQGVAEVVEADRPYRWDRGPRSAAAARSRSSCCSMPCAWAWRVVDTRAYAATRISVLLGDQHQAGQAALPGLTRQQLVGLIPPALAVLARAVLTADGPGPVHQALLPAQHRYEEQIPATAADGATRSGSAATAARSRTCHL